MMSYGFAGGFKLIQALGSNRQQTIDDLSTVFRFSCSSYCGRYCPMTGENRVLAYYGYKLLMQPRPGIKAWYQVKKH
jgi:single-stranded-DNA-specific exonuclease